MMTSADNITIVKNIPEEVITLILTSLPVKSLMRFKCVCKDWHNLIQTPDFIKMHQQSMKNKKNECLLIKRSKWENDERRTVFTYHSYESFNAISPDWEIPFSSNHVSWPCNGLLLCLSLDNNLFLCNPGTREYKQLPSISFSDSKTRQMFTMSIGLGFDSNKQDYKVIAFCVHAQVYYLYNLSSNSWREIKHDLKLPFPYVNSSFRLSGLQVNGALHWDAGHDYRITYILSFNLSTEVFQQIKYPEIIPRNSNIIITIVNDSLGLFSCGVWRTDIWVMKEYGVVESWTKIYSTGIDMERYNGNYYICPHLLWKNEAIIISRDKSKNQEKYILCDLGTYREKDTELITSDNKGDGIILYNESLVSIK